MSDFFDEGDDFTDDESFEDDNPDPMDGDHSDYPGSECHDLDWEDIAFLGAMAEEIAEDETRRRRLERQEEKERDDFDDPM
jgi:hypothetical protein